MKNFSELTEQELLALAITLEEEDTLLIEREAVGTGEMDAGRDLSRPLVDERNAPDPVSPCRRHEDLLLVKARGDAIGSGNDIHQPIEPAVRAKSIDLTKTSTDQQAGASSEDPVFRQRQAVDGLRPDPP